METTWPDYTKLAVQMKEFLSGNIRSIAVLSCLVIRERRRKERSTNRDQMFSFTTIIYLNFKKLLCNPGCDIVILSFL